MKSKNQPPMKQGSPDSFQTPSTAITPLIPYLDQKWVIWECAEGKGNLTKALAESGFKVYGSDILTGTDFLTTGSAMCDCIITNPPYSLKEKFLERCYATGKPFALLMPLTALESEKRQTLYRKYGIQLLIPNKRYNFETPSGKGGGAWFLTCWYCHRLNLPKDLNFVGVN